MEKPPYCDANTYNNNNNKKTEQCSMHCWCVMNSRQIAVCSLVAKTVRLRQPLQRHVHFVHMANIQNGQSFNLLYFTFFLTQNLTIMHSVSFSFFY